MAMPWELDKPVQQPVAMPWELDAPVQQPKVEPVRADPFAGFTTDSAAMLAARPTANMFDMSQPVDLSAGADPAADQAWLARRVADVDPTGIREKASDAYVKDSARKGIVDIADAVIDPILYNARLTGNLFSGNFDPRYTPLQTSTINTLLDNTLIPQVDPTLLDTADRLKGAAVRGATGALVGGALTRDPTKMLLGDTMAGAGAGITGQAYHEFTPESIQEKLGPLGVLLANIVGGVGGGTLASAGQSLYNVTTDSVRDMAARKWGAFTDPSTPIDAATGLPFKPSEMDMAARIAKNIPTNADQVVANLDDAARQFADVPADAWPTTGMLADDVGMAVNENVARRKDAAPFANRDAERNAFASRQIDQTVPKGADAQDLVNEMTNQYDSARKAAQVEVENAKLQQQLAADDINRQNATLTEARNRQKQSSAALDAEFRRRNEAATAEKNALYDAVPDTTPVSGDALVAALDDIDAGVPRAAREGTDYAGAVARIRRLVMDSDAEGNPIPRDITYGDARVLKTELSALRKDAVAAGRDVTHIDKLNQLMGGVIDEINPEAARNYAEEFAPRFRTGKAGEYSQALKRAVRTGDESSGTRPSEFGQKFLTKPEDARSLQRAIDVNGNPVTAKNATEWMMGDLARSDVLNAKAEVRFDKFKQWADRNKDVIDQFPEMRKRVDTELAQAQRGGKLSRFLSDQVKRAEQNLGDTEVDLRRSSLQKAIGNNPVNTIDGIMRSGDPAKMMDDLISRIGNDVKARDGLKDATRQWLRDEAGTTAKNVGRPGTYRYSRAKMEKLFREHESTLTKVYSPEEMNTLRRAHKLLDVAANLDVKTTAGSDTFQAFFEAGKDTTTKRNRMLEAALKAKYGVLRGGGYFRTLRLFFDAVGSMSAKTGNVETILTDMWFNQDLAKHLLTRNVREIGTPAWNAKLNRLLAAAAGNRADDGVEDTEKEKPTNEVAK